jgi:hypothetical protein
VSLCDRGDRTLRCTLGPGPGYGALERPAPGCGAAAAHDGLGGVLRQRARCERPSGAAARRGAAEPGNRERADQRSPRDRNGGRGRPRTPRRAVEALPPRGVKPRRRARGSQVAGRSGAHKSLRRSVLRRPSSADGEITQPPWPASRARNAAEWPRPTLRTPRVVRGTSASRRVRARWFKG